MESTSKNYGQKQQLHLWQVLVTKKLDDALVQAIRENAHVSKSDLIREAVRGKLTEMGFLGVVNPHVRGNEEPAT